MLKIDGLALSAIYEYANPASKSFTAVATTSAVWLIACRLRHNSTYTNTTTIQFVFIRLTCQPPPTTFYGHVIRTHRYCAFLLLHIEFATGLLCLIHCMHYMRGLPVEGVAEGGYRCRTMLFVADRLIPRLLSEAHRSKRMRKEEMRRTCCPNVVGLISRYQERNRPMFAAVIWQSEGYE